VGFATALPTLLRQQSVALSGEKAIEITHKMIPDIILLDIKMSGIDGFETCRLLKKCGTQGSTDYFYHCYDGNS